MTVKAGQIKSRVASDDDLDGGAGTDTLDFSSSTASVRVSLTHQRAPQAGTDRTPVAFEDVRGGSGFAAPRYRDQSRDGSVPLRAQAVTHLRRGESAGPDALAHLRGEVGALLQQGLRLLRVTSWPSAGDATATSVARSSAVDWKIRMIGGWRDEDTVPKLTRRRELRRPNGAPGGPSE